MLFSYPTPVASQLPSTSTLIINTTNKEHLPFLEQLSKAVSERLARVERGVTSNGGGGDERSGERSFGNDIGIASWEVNGNGGAVGVDIGNDNLPITEMKFDMGDDDVNDVDVDEIISMIESHHHQQQQLQQQRQQQRQDDVAPSINFGNLEDHDDVVTLALHQAAVAICSGVANVDGVGVGVGVGDANGLGGGEGGAGGRDSVGGCDGGGVSGDTNRNDISNGGFCEFNFDDVVGMMMCEGLDGGGGNDVSQENGDCGDAVLDVGGCVKQEDAGDNVGGNDNSLGLGYF
ncbi:hypothetical protein HDU76_006648 [Blyttiomyces sp. JEL0837]|nr:hypothetical protein HDU76_006648 [Blyttiomyces sp. JEL0837]